ncbi:MULTISPECIES: hypothetical protein [Streptomyces]|uniref:Uncharacterized protein n=1 Tax=Streptomyces yangpuensis TaxID=1648182 RepID=A0ABY5PPJ6_9ACTN|nr:MULTISPECIES: hypothetical protein [Streptomyces]UUY45805.1 hypothetical protein NRK68_00410 [Streptomyces yangpuensis]
MATYTKPALNPQTFDELIQRLTQDEQERRRAIGIVQNEGALAFGDEYFALTDKQREMMVEVTSDPAEAFRWKALIGQGLADGIPISIIPVETESSIDISIHTEDVDIDIHIECPI